MSIRIIIQRRLNYSESEAFAEKVERDCSESEAFAEKVEQDCSESEAFAKAFTT